MTRRGCGGTRWRRTHLPRVHRGRLESIAGAPKRGSGSGPGSPPGSVGRIPALGRAKRKSLWPDASWAQFPKSLTRPVPGAITVATRSLPFPHIKGQVAAPRSRHCSNPRPLLERRGPLKHLSSPRLVTKGEVHIGGSCGVQHPTLSPPEYLRFPDPPHSQRRSRWQSGGAK